MAGELRFLRFIYSLIFYTPNRTGELLMLFHIECTVHGIDIKYICVLEYTQAEFRP